MVILGLGSNLGDRVENLRWAIRALAHGSQPLLREIQVSPLYESQALLPHESEASWNRPFLNLALAGETNLKPQELLNAIKEIEVKKGRQDLRKWSPRPLDIDILAWDEKNFKNEMLTVPHPGLLERPFALLPLAHVAPFWKHPENQKTALELSKEISAKETSESNLETRLYNLPTSNLVGILNITPDSFSDGGKFSNLEKALEHASQLVAQGANVLDVGAESTRPGAIPLDADEEWTRLKPILQELPKHIGGLRKNIILSIDTRHGRTATLALEHGAHWINDVTGFESRDMIQAVKNSSCKIVVMHHLGVPPTADRILPTHEDPIPPILHWGQHRLQKLADLDINPERIIFDPGIGFGKMPAQNLKIMTELGRLKNLGCPLLIGPSRKSFLGDITQAPPSQRDLETATLCALVSNQGVDYIRVHSPEFVSRALKVAACVHGAFV